MAAYTGNRAASNDLALEASPVAAGIISFVEDRDHWIGTSSELLKELTRRTTDDAQRQKGFPKAANSLSGILKRIAPNLRAAGVNFTRPNRAGKKGARLIELERINISSSEVSEAAAMRDVHADSLGSSDDLAGSQNISDDLSGDSRQALSRENAVETASSANADDADDFSQGFSSHIAEYEPDEEELIYEAEERAAIMAESNAL